MIYNTNKYLISFIPLYCSIIIIIYFLKKNQNSQDNIELIINLWFFLSFTYYVNLIILDKFYYYLPFILQIIGIIQGITPIITKEFSFFKLFF